MNFSCIVGLVTTLAGSKGTSGSADGYGTAALFNSPICMAMDTGSNILVGDSNGIRVVDSTGLCHLDLWLRESESMTLEYAGRVTTLCTFAARGIAVSTNGNIYASNVYSVVLITTTGRRV
jgi:hypothetical protein